MTKTSPLKVSPARTLSHESYPCAGTPVFLVVLLVVLFWVPSGLQIEALVSAGRPVVLFGLGLGIWLISRWGKYSIPASALTGVLFLFLLATLVADSWGLTNSVTGELLLPLITGVMRVVSWVAIALYVGIAAAGRRRWRFAQTAAVAVITPIAVLGIAQSLTSNSLLGWIKFPGIQIVASDISDPFARGGLFRISGTSAHPLEFAYVLAVLFPIALSIALERPQQLLRWSPAVLIAAASVLTLSRSSIIGLAVGFLFILPGLPPVRAVVFALVTVLATAIACVMIPRLFYVFLNLFGGIGTDPSAASRQNGLEAFAQYLDQSPVLGRGLGTFLPDVYIFDNTYILLSLEVGLIGAGVFVVLLATTLANAVRVRRRSSSQDALRSQAVVASIVVCIVLFLFFDGLSFLQSAGLCFYLIGLVIASDSLPASEIADFGASVYRRSAQSSRRRDQYLNPSRL